MRGATIRAVQVCDAEHISIHAPRAGSDRMMILLSVEEDRFQSTLPVRGATRDYCKSKATAKDFNPRSPCGERQEQHRSNSLHRAISIHAPRAGSDPLAMLRELRAKRISIHAPRAGSDRRYPFGSHRNIRISIHAPRAGSDDSVFAYRYKAGVFQSTLPVRGATRHAHNVRFSRCNFNPRSPCGERQNKLVIYSA